MIILVTEKNKGSRKTQTYDTFEGGLSIRSTEAYINGIEGNTDKKFFQVVTKVNGILICNSIMDEDALDNWNAYIQNLTRIYNSIHKYDTDISIRASYRIDDIKNKPVEYVSGIINYVFPSVIVMALESDETYFNQSPLFGNSYEAGNTYKDRATRFIKDVQEYAVLKGGKNE